MGISPEITDIILRSVEQSGASFFITDADGVILYANPAFEQVSGWKNEEVIGKKPDMLKSGEHPQEFYKDLWKTVKAGKPWSGRLVNRKKDGSLFNEEIRIYPVRNEAGEIKHFFTLRHDITKEVELETQLSQSQKMESLGLLAGQVAHDFNNLLTVIIGSMELVGEDLKPESVSRKLTTEILRASKEYAALIRQLLTFTRRGEAKPQPVNMNEAVGEVKMMLDSLLGKNISVAYSLEPELKRVKIDPEQLKQVLMNLAVNARDAMNGKGGLMISTRNVSPEQAPPSLPPGGYAALDVGDTGPGIPPEILPRIFEPFFTTKPKGKGTGLGLSTAYGMVTQARGMIFAVNRSGGGAVFSIYLPAILQ